MKNKKLFIAYYWDKNEDKDAETYIGETGTDEEFIKYFMYKHETKIEEVNIDSIYPIITEKGIDGKFYKIIIK